jgi:hypothetical protein
MEIEKTIHEELLHLYKKIDCKNQYYPSQITRTTAEKKCYSHTQEQAFRMNLNGYKNFATTPSFLQQFEHKKTHSSH